MILNETPVPFRLKKIVLPQHTDHAGVMWHGAYVSWIEEIRVETLNSVGLNYFDLSSSGYEFPVVSLNIDYKTKEPMPLSDIYNYGDNLGIVNNF